MTPTIVFLCVHNAGRSQMAAGFARAMSGGRVRVLSGGSDPAERVNPVAVEAMSERGIDISSATPQKWDVDDIRTASVVITMGCGDECPFVPGVRYEDWALADPSGLAIDQMRVIRDEISERVRDLLGQLGVDAQS